MSDVRTPARRPANWAERLADLLQPADAPSLSVYGTITIGALLAAETTGRETRWESAGGVAVALVMYVIAHGYSAMVGERLKDGTPFALSRLGLHLVRATSILRGAFLPLVVMLLSWAAGGNNNQNVVAALVAAAVTLAILEVVAAVRSRLRPGELAVQALLGTALGLGILAMRAVLH